MKVSLNWLTEYVDVSAIPARQLAERLTMIGLCCDAVEETDSDIVLDLDVTSNRPDCLGHVGIARELAAALGLPLRLPDLSSLPAAAPPASALTSVQVLCPDLCPRYTARVISGAKIGPSPRWMVERLSAVGLRSINNVVDVTNYVMLEFSQPLHSFDMDKLAERRIVVRRGGRGEELVSIDGTRCGLDESMCVIADAQRPVAVAGIMGGLATEIGADTQNILLEAAQFDMMTTRKTARALRLMSESSYRFERGVDPVGVELASRRACQLILQVAGGTLHEGVVDAWAAPFAPRQVALRTARCRRLLGMDVPDAEQARLLEHLHLAPRLADGIITCAIPPHRPDLEREVDLIEEVGRLWGYDKVPTRHNVTHVVQPAGKLEVASRRLREVLTAAGFDEAITFPFLDEAEPALLGFGGQVRIDPRVRRTNNVLRPSLVPSLLRACKINQDAGNEGVNLYELAAVFPPAQAGADALPDEHVQLALVSHGDVHGLRGVIEALVQQVAPPATLEVSPPTGPLAAPVPHLAEGASAVLRVDGQTAGTIGMVNQAALDYYGLEKPWAAATLRFDALLAHAGVLRKYQPFPVLPASTRDLSVVVAEEAAWRQLEEVIRAGAEPALERLEYVTTYRDKPVPQGRKSVTVRLTYRLPDQTLRHEQVDEMVDAVVARLRERLGAELRK